MPRINLLPAKKMARQEELRTEVRSLGYLAAGMALCMVAHALTQASQLDGKRAELTNVAGISDRLQSQLKELDQLKQGLAVLDKKLAVIDQLVAAKRGPSLVLGTFADVMSAHPRVWLSRFEQTGDTVRLAGNAMGQGDISAFHKDLASKAPVIRDVTLLLVNSSKDTSLGGVLEWSMTCRVQGGRAPAEGQQT